MGDVLQVSKHIEEAVEEQLQGAVAGRGRRSKELFDRAGKPRWRPWAIAGVSAAATVLLIIVAGVSMAYYSKLQAESERKKAELESRQPAAAAEMSYQPSTASGVAAPSPAPAPDPNGSAESNAPLIARSVNFVIVAKDVAATRPALDAILAKYHGYAADMTISTPADDAPSLKASLRIPVANLAAAMKELRGLGRVTNEEESGEDVTQQHADLDQRLKTARDTEDRLRAILQQRTGSINDVLQVEEEIARVRGDIESMEADQTNLERRVDFASIDLTVGGESSPVSGSAPLSMRVRDAFVSGYRNAAETVVGIFLFLVAYGLTVLIWVAILAVPVYFLRRRYRRMRAKV